MILILNGIQNPTIVFMIIGIIMIASSMQISDAISERQILEWSDFQKTENTSSEYDAFLSYGIKRSVDWQKIDSECSFQLVSLKSEIVIFSEKSWVKQDKKNDELLNHEQRHLDIVEIINRKGTSQFQHKMFQEIECDKNSSDKDIENKAKSIMIDFFNTIEKEHRELQHRYDHETEHGTDKIKQKEWDKKIDCLLKNVNAQLCTI